MHGDGGILSRVDELAASELLPGASSYCKACRKRTWLSDDAAAADTNAAVLYFWHQWRANKRIASSMERMRARLARTAWEAGRGAYADWLAAENDRVHVALRVADAALDRARAEAMLAMAEGRLAGVDGGSR